MLGESRASFKRSHFIDVSMPHEMRSLFRLGRPSTFETINIKMLDRIIKNCSKISSMEWIYFEEENLFYIS